MFLNNLLHDYLVSSGNLLTKYVCIQGGLSNGGDTLTEVELAAQSLVTSGHDLHIGAEEEAVQ